MRLMKFLRTTQLLILLVIGVFAANAQSIDVVDGTIYAALTQTQRDAIPLGANDKAIVNNITSGNLEYWDGAQWVVIGAGGNYLVVEDIDTSAEIATIVTDETGTGQLVFGTSPMLSTPTLTGATLSGNILPSADDSYSIGNTNFRLASIYNGIYIYQPEVSDPTFTVNLGQTFYRSDLGKVSYWDGSQIQRMATESYVSTAVAAGDNQTAAEVPVTPNGNLASTDVQAALQEHQSDIDALTAGGSDGVVTGVSLVGTDLTFAGTGGAFTGPVALASLQDGTGTDDQVASEVPSTPSGNLAATDVQAALNELQTDVDSRALTSSLSSYVTLAGSQSITGSKFFNSSLYTQSILGIGDSGFYLGEDNGVLGKRWYISKNQVTDKIQFNFQDADGTTESGAYTNYYTLDETGVPTEPNDLTDKAYVDAQVSGAGSGTYLPLAGGTMSGQLNMGSQNIIGINGLYLPGTGGNFSISYSGALFQMSGPSAANIMQFEEGPDIWTIGGSQIMTASNLAGYLPLAGGTMSGNINMSGGEITSLGVARFNPTDTAPSLSDGTVYSSLANETLMYREAAEWWRVARLGNDYQDGMFKIPDVAEDRNIHIGSVIGGGEVDYNTVLNSGSGFFGNVSLGTNAGLRAGYSSLGTVNIGYKAGDSSGGSESVNIGFKAGSGMVDSDYSVAVGAFANAWNNTYGTFLGYRAAENARHADVAIGFEAGRNNYGYTSTGYLPVKRNIFMGYGAGRDLSGTNNIIIGSSLHSASGFLDAGTAVTFTDSDITWDTDVVTINAPSHGLGNTDEFRVVRYTTTGTGPSQTFGQDFVSNQYYLVHVADANTLKFYNPNDRDLPPYTIESRTSHILTPAKRFNGVNILGNDIIPTRDDATYFAGDVAVMLNSTVADIDAVGNKALVTKEWVDAQAFGGGGITWSTPVNSDITFDTDQAYDIGTNAAKPLNVYAAQFLGSIQGNNGIFTTVEIADYARFSDKTVDLDPTGFGANQMMLYYNNALERWRSAQGATSNVESFAYLSDLTAANISFTPYSTLAATTVQGAIQELLDESSGGGNVSKVGTPIDGQIGVWTGDGTLEGTNGLTYNGSLLSLAGGLDMSGQFTVSVDGGTGAAPRILGFNDFNSVGETARFQFGDAYNSLTNTFSKGMILTSYHTLFIRGGRQTLDGGLNGATQAEPLTDVAVQLTLEQPDHSVQVKTLSASPTVPLQVWTNSSDADVASVDHLGNLAVSGTVDGRDLAADGTKLDGIESGATADQTASEVPFTPYFSLTSTNVQNAIEEAHQEHYSNADISGGFLRLFKNGAVATSLGLESFGQKGALTATGTTINLIHYYQYNFSAASSATTYTFTNNVAGGYAECLVNAPTEPTITGATKIPNTQAFIANTDMIMHVKVFGTTVKYWFTEF